MCVTIFMDVCVRMCVNGTYKRCDNKEIRLISDMQMSTETFRIQALGRYPLIPMRLGLHKPVGREIL